LSDLDVNGKLFLSLSFPAIIQRIESQLREIDSVYAC
jgi:hypothetical protein